MDPVVASALISTAGDVSAQTGSLLAQAFFGKRNERWAREDATTAYNRQRQLLAEQRAYESPAAQMQRYIDAGLHPGLIYGQQQGSIAPPSVPQAQSTGVNYSGVPNGMFDQLLNAQLIEAQIERLRTQNENDTNMTSGQLERWAKENGVSLAQAELYQQQKNVAIKEYDRIGKEMELLDQDIIDKQIENQFKKETFQDRVQATMDEYKMTHEKAKRFTRILEASIADTWASANFKNKQSWQIEQLTPSEVRLKDAMAAYYRNAANKTLTENQILELDKTLKDIFGVSLTLAQIQSLLGKPFQGFFSWANSNSDFGQKVSDLK